MYAETSGHVSDGAVAMHTVTLVNKSAHPAMLRLEYWTTWQLERWKPRTSHRIHLRLGLYGPAWFRRWCVSHEKNGGPLSI